MEVFTLYKELALKEGDVIVFGCSYGPDSMALFKSLLLVRESVPIKLVCAHINHGKRVASKEEKKDLEAYCLRENVVFEYMKITDYGDDNFHNEARHIRYQFFEQLVHKYRAKYLLTAHHGDDLIETILMRIVRGSTLEGYSGFKKMIAMDGYAIYRPFIEYSKDQLLAFNKKYHVPYALDSSNDSDVYTRNRYRKEVLPFLKKEDPLVHEKFLKFSNTLASASYFVEQETNKAMKKVVVKNKILIHKFLEQEAFIQRTILETVLAEFYQDDLLLIGEKHLQLILRLMHSTKANSEVCLPNDVLVTKRYNEISLRKSTNEINHYEIELIDQVLLPNGRRLQVTTEDYGNSNCLLRLSSKEVVLPLRVRTREYGDIMAIKGGGHKKLKDIFIEKKIPLEERDLWPVVVDAENRIVFIPGLKKSKFDRKKEEFYDIILRYE